MGYYIQGPAKKVDYILSTYNGVRLEKAPKSIIDLTEGQGLVCIVDNGPFQAAAFVFDDGELDAFTQPGDGRSKVWVSAPWELVSEASGFSTKK